MRALLILAPLALAACGSNADRQADALDNAAAQSDPAARPAIENAADAMRESGSGNAQEALAAGGEAQLGTPASPQSDGRTPPPMVGPASDTQAAPNTGDRQIPRPQIEGRR